MLLSWQPAKGNFVLKVNRSSGINPEEIVRVHGLDYSDSRSTAENAVLFTSEPHAAVSFFQHGTPEAKEKLSSIQLAIEESRAKVGVANYRVPDGQELWPFQKAGISYALQRRNCLIGDQPGLGKTPMAIAFANEIRAKKVLVVCPANIRLQWAKMIRAWSTMEGKYHVYPILKSSDGVNPHAHWTCISFDLASSGAVHRALLGGNFDLLILDEAHYLKTPDAERTRHVFGGQRVVDGDSDTRTFEHITGLAERAERVLALTGSPLPNRPRECYTLARHLNFDSIDWMSETHFQARFNPSAMMPSGWRKEMTGRLPELQNRLRANFMIRRLKREVLTQLPAIQHTIMHVDNDSPIRAALRAENMLHIDPTDLSGHDAMVLGHISGVRKMMGLALAPHAAKHANMLLDGGEDKIFLVGWHIEVLNILEWALRKEGHGLVRVDGSTSANNKQLAVDRFVQDPKTRVFLGNAKSVGVGTDGLQKVCRRVILAEVSWTPSDNEQAIARLERIGQWHGIDADYIVAEGSFSERVLATSIKKMQGIHEALDKEHS